MKKIIATALFLLVGACSAVQVATTPVDTVSLQKAAFAARATYVGLLEVAVNVTDMPRCERAPAPCVYQATVNKIRSVQKTAGDATKQADELARNPGTSPTVLSVSVDAATRAVTVFKSTVESNEGRK